MAEKKTTTKKKAPAKKSVVKKTVAKKVAVKKVTVKKAPAKKAAPKKGAVKAKVEPAVAVQKATEQGVRPTTYAEVGRIHRGTFSSHKGSVVVTSSHPGEGVTLLAHLMAQRSAESGVKVLLIDLNLRNEHLSHEMDVPTKPWKLIERKDGDTLSDLIEPVADLPGLYFMSAPMDHETALFLKDVERAKKFFKNLEKQYDHIVVDATPVGALNRSNVDPMILASAAKRTVVVMLAAMTPRRVIARTIEQLRDAGAKVEGVVVNDQKNPSVKGQLLSFVNALQRIAPGLSDWLRHKIMHNQGLG